MNMHKFLIAILTAILVIVFLAVQAEEKEASVIVGTIIASLSLSLAVCWYDCVRSFKALIISSKFLSLDPGGSRVFVFHYRWFGFQSKLSIKEGFRPLASRRGY
jgi:hypothetical protein